jgi:hypothetical protein
MTRAYDKGLTMEQSIIATLERITFLTASDLIVLLRKSPTRVYAMLSVMAKQGKVVRTGPATKPLYALPGQTPSRTKDSRCVEDDSLLQQWQMVALRRVLQEIGLLGAEA